MNQKENKTNCGSCFGGIWNLLSRVCKTTEVNQYNTWDNVSENKGNICEYDSPDVVDRLMRKASFVHQNLAQNFEDQIVYFPPSWCDDVKQSVDLYCDAEDIQSFPFWNKLENKKVRIVTTFNGYNNEKMPNFDSCNVRYIENCDQKLKSRFLIIDERLLILGNFGCTNASIEYRLRTDCCETLKQFRNQFWLLYNQAADVPKSNETLKDVIISPSSICENSISENQNTDNQVGTKTDFGQQTDNSDISVEKIQPNNLDYIVGYAHEFYITRSSHEIDMLQYDKEIEIAKKNLGTESSFLTSMNIIDKPVEAIKNWIKQTKSSLDVCMYSFTNNDFSKELIKLVKRKCSVRIIGDDSGDGDYHDQLPNLAKSGCKVKYLGKKIDEFRQVKMHHKLAIRDNSSVLFGSFNWTNSAAKRNYETALTTVDPNIVNQLRLEFLTLWNIACQERKQKSAEKLGQAPNISNIRQNQTKTKTKIKTKIKS